MPLIWSRRWKPHWRNSVLAALILPLLAAADQPATAIGDQSIEVSGMEGSGVLPAFSSVPLLQPLAGIHRAIIVIPGPGHLADQALQQGVAAIGAAAAETLVVVPQFLDQQAFRQASLSADRLRWAGAGWTDGGRALGPAPLSAFAVLDSLLHTLADPGLLPDLRAITLAGQDEGADLVQLYAAVATHLQNFDQRGVALRFVLIEPDHYLYLDQARPIPPKTACADADRWPFGLDSVPDYVGPLGAAPILRQYRARDVVYLLGPPGAPEDAACATAAQGPDRSARGRFYLAYLAALAGAPMHHLAAVAEPGDAAALLASPCGVAALLDQPVACPTLAASPELLPFPLPEPPATSPPAIEPPATSPPVIEGPAPPPELPGETIEPGGIADPLRDANPLAPVLTRKPPPPKPASPR